ncbi:MAG: hypothetical protein ABIR91_03365 [Candidatus Saccharimonadales bacterium]
MLNIQTDKILQQQMDRKMFLKTTGIALVGLVGVTAIAKRLDVFGNALTPLTQTTTGSVRQGQATSSSALAYGRSPYGV